MSIVLSKVAEPYAEALLDLAKSNGSLKETTNDMNIVSQFLANSSDLKKFLGNPLITKNAKKTVVKDKLNLYNLEKFSYLIDREILKGENILINTNFSLPTSDKFYFKSAIINLKEQSFLGNDAVIKVKKDIFDNSKVN